MTVFLKLCLTFNFFAFQNTESSGDVIAPIATPEKSRSSSGDTLEEIKEETEAVIIKNNPCTTTESSTNSEASMIASKPSSSSTGIYKKSRQIIFWPIWRTFLNFGGS